MQLLTDENARLWARTAGFPTSNVWISASAYHTGILEPHFRVQIPDDATAIVALAYMVAITGAPDYDESKFHGALLWLRRWEIWSESIDRTGYALLDGVRGASGRETPIGTAPAHLLELGEFFKACALLSLPMFFQWDAQFFALDASYHVSVSHDGYLYFGVRERERYEELFIRFKDWGPTTGEHTSSP